MCEKCGSRCALRRSLTCLGSIEPSGRSLEEMLRAGLKLWIPDPQGYAVYQDSAPQHGLAVYGSGDELMKAELSQQYRDVYGEYQLEQLNHFVQDNLLQCIVVVKAGNTAAQLRNGVSGADTGL
jgi:hypothetical protein